MKAHEQLLAKRKAGQIDVYFMGDSITRRWGATDAQYQDLLANWRANFTGWNAANFGWGADKTQHMLWRLQNGELDGVNPKVVVLMAGTNNVGRATPLGDVEERAAEVARGVTAVVREIRQTRARRHCHHHRHHSAERQHRGHARHQPCQHGRSQRWPTAKDTLHKHQ